LALTLGLGALAIFSSSANATGVIPTLTGAANFSNTSATLYGVVSPGGVSTTIAFCYSTSVITITGGNCTVPSGTISYASANQSPTASSSNVTATAAISGLTAATKYYYAIGASQSVGVTNWTAAKNFTTITGGAFICTPNLYQVNNDYTWEFSPTTNSFLKLNSIAQTTGLNALGYDAENNYLYAMGSSGGDLFQIGVDGAENNLGVPSLAPQTTGADFIPDTNFLLTASSAGGFDLTDVASPALTTVSMGSTGSTFAANDITWTVNSSDTDYVGYGLKGTGTNTATLYIVTLPVADIPASSANWSAIPANPLAVTADTGISLSGGASTSTDSYGAAYSDSTGDSFFYDNTQEELFEATAAQLASLGTQTFVFRASSASTSGFSTGANDGASCPNATSPFAAPTPINDSYAIATNTSLSAVTASSSVFNNDQVVAGTSYNMDDVVLEPGANQVTHSFTASASSGALVGTNGTLDITNANLGYFTFTPNSGFTGTETFTYDIDETAPNNGVSTTTATVSINVVHQQVVSWAIGNDLSTSAASTAPAPATDLGAAPLLYSVNTADSNTADCSVNASTGVITYFAAGVCTIDASAAATSTYTAGFAELTFNVTSLVIPTLSWFPSPSSTPVSPSGTTITPAPTTDSPGAITYAIASTNDTAGCTLASSSAPIVLMSSAQGVCSITATVAASGSYAVETITAPFAILATPTLSWAPSPTSFTTIQSPQTIGGVTTNSDGAITYAIDGSADTAGCSLTSSSAPVILHFTTPGGCTIDASVAPSTTFAAAAISQSFSVTTAPPSTITQSAPFANGSPDTASQSFTAQLVTTGQSGTVSFSASGSLPAGVSVSSSGLIASNGTTPSGVYTLSGTDGDTSSDSGTWTYVLTVNSAGGTITQTNTSGSVNAGNPFTDTITTSGNDGAVTFTTTSSGNAFTVSSSGAVSSPDTLASGPYTVSGTDVDAFGNAGNWTYTLTVNHVAGAIATVHDSGTTPAGTAFTDAITASGNVGAVTYTTTSSGNAFTVNSSGDVSATGTLAHGVYLVSGTDVDASSDAGSWTYTLTVTLTAVAPRGGTIAEGTSIASVNAGTAFNGTIATTGNDGSVTFSTSAGGSFTVSPSGAISAPSSLTPGVYALSGIDSDGHGDTGVWTFTLTVVAAPPTISVAPAAPGAVGQTYTPVVVSSGPMVTITSSTPAVCRVRNGVVTYLASGTCALSFVTAASVDYPAATTVTQHITVRVPAKVHLTLFDFANDEWALTPSMLNRLNVLARTIMRDDDTHISISGYASSTGGVAHNVLLSRKRAAVVTRYLLAGLKDDGATVAALRSLGHGAANFVSPDSAAAVNRRVSVYAW